MKTVLFLSLLAIFASATELDVNKYRHIHYCYLNGMRYAFAISDDEFAKMRQWNPTSIGQPPVTPQHALELARKRLNAIKIPEGYGWKLASISLEPVTTPADLAKDEKWIYVVGFDYESFNTIMTGHWPTMDFIVTMDGKLIQPIIDEARPNR